MHAEVVDPRDQRWENSRPRYRVQLWGPGDWACSDWDITDAPDVDTVLRWADEQTPPEGRSVVALVVDDEQRGRGLVLLSGSFERELGPDATGTFLTLAEPADD